VIVLTILCEDFPSPNGERDGRFGVAFNDLVRAFRILFLFIPTTLANPLSTASGLSVESLRTSTGFLM